MSERVFGFIAIEANLVFYNAKALLNIVFSFYYDDTSNSIYDFPGYVSAYFRVYDERNGQLIKNWTSQVTRNSNNLVINSSVSDVTFSDNGKYFYEMGYITSGGYEIPVRYGRLDVI